MLKDKDIHKAISRIINKDYKRSRDLEFMTTSILLYCNQDYVRDDLYWRTAKRYAEAYIKFADDSLSEETMKINKEIMNLLIDFRRAQC